MQRISEVMTRNVCTVSPHEVVQRAAQLMDELNVGALPVCDGDRLVGMVTDRDIAVRATAAGRAPDQAHVEDVMSADVRWCFEDQPLDEVMRQMSGTQIRRVPVVSHDEAHRLVGIVSLGDLATKAASDDKVEQVVEKVSTPSEPDRSRRGNATSRLSAENGGGMSDQRDGANDGNDEINDDAINQAATGGGDVNASGVSVGIYSGGADDIDRPEVTSDAFTRGVAGGLESAGTEGIGSRQGTGTAGTAGGLGTTSPGPGASTDTSASTSASRPGERGTSVPRAAGEIATPGMEGIGTPGGTGTAGTAGGLAGTSAGPGVPTPGPAPDDARVTADNTRRDEPAAGAAGMGDTGGRNAARDSGAPGGTDAAGASGASGGTAGAAGSAGTGVGKKP